MRDGFSGAQRFAFVRPTAERSSANSLRAGDQLRLGDGSPAYVTGVEATGIIEPVYNFSVDGWKTYHVGALGVWVHNICSDELFQMIAESGMTRREFDRLIGGWSKGTYDTVADSIFDHATRHFEGDIARYMRIGGDIQGQIAARSRGWSLRRTQVYRQGTPEQYVARTWDGPNGRFAIIDDSGLLRTWGIN